MTENEARINVQIAEKVFGWVQYPTKRGFYYFGPPDAFSKEFAHAEGIAVVEFCGHDIANAPDFLHDCNASKMLRDKLDELGFKSQHLWRSPDGFIFDCAFADDPFSTISPPLFSSSEADEYIASEFEAVVRCCCSAFSIKWEDER